MRIKDKPVSIYMREEDKILIKEAAEIQGLDLSGFCRMAAISLARNLIKDYGKKDEPTNTN